MVMLMILTSLLNKDGSHQTSKQEEEEEEEEESYDHHCTYSIRAGVW